MGLIDFLSGTSGKRRKIEVVPDRIWMTAEAKFEGVAKEVVERSKSKADTVLLVAHFPDVLKRLEMIASLHVGNTPCRAVLASNLNANWAASLTVDESAILDIIVGERHPLPTVDDRLQEFAVALPCRCRFSHHLSLDDDLIGAFAGDWVKNLLKQLGMKEDEALESQMVSRRIRKAQQVIEGRVCGSLYAESAAEWLSRNCPELVKK
jgi:preprotein translocase subunit SecA